MSLRLERSGRFAEHSGTDSNLMGYAILLPIVAMTTFQPDSILLDSYIAAIEQRRQSL